MNKSLIESIDDEFVHKTIIKIKQLFEEDLNKFIAKGKNADEIFVTILMILAKFSTDICDSIPENLMKSGQMSGRKYVYESLIYMLEKYKDSPEHIIYGKLLN